MLNELITFRKELHTHPERSGEETDTAERILQELQKCRPDNILDGVGGTGVLAYFASKKSKLNNTLLFRAELDAIAVTEATGLPHQSTNNGVMHGCGHDGHMAILIGLARYLQHNRPENTSVLLLFQPAEETGKGAAQVLDDSRFTSLKIDHAFALHNLPGFDENTIYIKPGPFACASTGVEITVSGTFSHAAYPEQGLNPAACTAGLIQEIETALKPFREKEALNKVVPTFIRMGEPAYGISPGEATIGYTLRSSTDEGLEDGLSCLEQTIKQADSDFKGKVTFRRMEPFAATINSHKGVEIVEKAAASLSVPLATLQQPFPWSEDFGEFRRQFPITLFGLGSGNSHPPLHSEQYDFNDDLIPAGIKIFSEIVAYYDSL
jgi:amidohydrolase